MTALPASERRIKTSETVLKALSVLDQFLLHQRPLTLTELAAATAIHKTTVLRLCRSLVTAGLLQRNSAAAYFVGPKIWQLAQVYQQGVSAEALIRPLLVRLRAATGESASFYVRDAEWRVCMFRENALQPVRHHLEEGVRLPLREGVVGRVLLAFAGERGGEYDAIRRDGHLVARGREPHTASVAAPVLAANGDLLGALVVSGPVSRFHARARRAALGALEEACADLKRHFRDQHSLFPAPDRPPAQPRPAVTALADG